MQRDIRVFVLDRDPFVRNWIALLLARDWRTHFSGDAGSLIEFSKIISAQKPHLDAVIVEADLIANEQSLKELKRAISSFTHAPSILLNGSKPDPRMFNLLGTSGIKGYVTRDEIGYSLAWAVTFLEEGWVMTPAIHEAIYQAGVQLVGKGSVINGKRPIAELTEREIEAVRLALLFGLERHDLADEMNISKDWSYGLISSIYKKLGLDDILEGEVDPTLYLGNNELMLLHLKGIVSQLHGSPKATDIETLAFHVFTMPEIDSFGGKVD